MQLFISIREIKEIKLFFISLQFLFFFLFFNLFVLSLHVYFPSCYFIFYIIVTFYYISILFFGYFISVSHFQGPVQRSFSSEVCSTNPVLHFRWSQGQYCHCCRVSKDMTIKTIFFLYLFQWIFNL